MLLAAVAAGDVPSDVARTDSLHVAAVLGLEAEARRLLAEDPAQLRARAGDPPGEPLLWLCYSPLADERLAGTARALIEAGADPNTRDGGEYGIPALYAVTGHREAPRIARLLLEAGANPTDGESAFHAAEHGHLEALDLLAEFAVDLNDAGDWGNTPLYFILRYHDLGPEHAGLRWLLEHGADPDVRCGRERETSLHVAARRAQPAAGVRLLLAAGADAGARRGDGRSAWLLARRAGADDVAALLETAGAEREVLSPADLLVAACARGDADTARRLAGPPDEPALLPDAAARGRFGVVHACVVAGFPLDARGDSGATALHHAAIQGHAPSVRELLEGGADPTIRDPEHDSDALGWAQFGREHAISPGGDYDACVAALKPV